MQAIDHRSVSVFPIVVENRTQVCVRSCGFDLDRQLTIDFVGQEIRPDIWTIVLGESGSGKTFATNEMEKLTRVENVFPNVASVARFVKELELHNRSIWIRDEIGQLIKAMNEQSYLSELKDVLLRVYDGKRVERVTKKEEIVIEDPALTILGLTVYSTFFQIIDTESLLDGFAQRFSYVVAREDKERPPEQFPIYDLRPYRQGIKDEWERLVESLPKDKTVFDVCDRGLDAFRVGFQTLMPPQDEVPISFFRRIMLRGVRYALLYHILMYRSGTVIDEQDMAWAGRLLGLHVKDAADLIFKTGGVSGSKLNALLLKADALKQRFRDEGRELKARDLVAYIWEIKTAAEARGLMNLM